LSLRRPPCRRSPRFPLEQRVAVVLVDGEGLDIRGAASLLGVPAGTVASRLSRGRARIRQLIAEEDT
jgi:RNA polymerase sigma-70 factor, ECF subfamily